MAKSNQTAISPTRDENYAEWYQQVIKAADMAENSPVRGCMIIKPWGCQLWENIRNGLDTMFKETAHETEAEAWQETRQMHSVQHTRRTGKLCFLRQTFAKKGCIRQKLLSFFVS